MFRINKLKVYDLEDRSYEYNFKEGLNYFSGGNNTGKTVFYNFLDYMFGGGQDISGEPWFKGTFGKAEMYFHYNGIEYVAVRTISKDINFFGYSFDEKLEPVNADVYKERLMSVFTPDEELLKEIRSFVEEDLTYRTFTLFNFLGETRQGNLVNFFDKCDQIRYSVKLQAILNFIFNKNLERIFQLRKEMQDLLEIIKSSEKKQQRFEFICWSVNQKLAQLDLKIRYMGYNAIEVKKELEKIKNMEDIDKGKRTNIAILETVYNNLREQIRVYENSIDDAKQFEKQSINQRKLMEQLKNIVETNPNYNYLVIPILALIDELEQSISFSKYVQKDETIDVLRKQLKQVRIKIRENDSRFKCYSVDEKAKLISIIEEYLDANVLFDEEELKSKKKRVREIKEELKFLQNADDIAKVEYIGKLMTEIYSFAGTCSDVVSKDISKKGFGIKYYKNGNIIQPIIASDEKEENYYTGSMARHTLMQLAGYLGFMKILLEENRYPIIPFLVLDHISKPFDKENAEAVGKLFEKAFELIGKDNFQVFIFDDEAHETLGIVPDHAETMVRDGKTGFNPFYRP